MTHICASNLTIIGSDNVALSVQAIIWINARILLIGTFRTNLREILSEIHTFLSRKCIWECRFQNGGHFYLGLNILKYIMGDWHLISFCTFSSEYHMSWSVHGKHVTVDGIGIININISLGDILSVRDSAEGYQLSGIAGPPTNDCIFNTHNSQISILKRGLWWWNGWHEEGWVSEGMLQAYLVI